MERRLEELQRESDGSSPDFDSDSDSDELLTLLDELMHVECRVMGAYAS